MKRRMCHLDVFTEQPLAGNGLAVVENADEVGDEAMLAYARETRLSETTYVQTAGDGGADYRNRIWTPDGEMRFAGHPSLGTAVAVARWREADEASLVQQTLAGLQPIDVRRDGENESGGELWRASMLQEPAEFGDELDRDRTMRAVGLEPGDAHPELPARMISTGTFHGIALIAHPAALARTAPDYAAVGDLLEPHDPSVLYVAYVDPDTGRGQARSFMRGAAASGEDPATGSAIGPLCAYVAEHLGVSEIVVEQGVEMGRPSLLEARVEGDRVRVSGAVVPVIDGTIELP